MGLNQETTAAVKDLNLKKVELGIQLDMYPDIVPFEHTVASLKNGQDRISGSIMPDHCIAMQGVTESNSSRVAQFLSEYNIPLIVRLTSFQEGNKKKTHNWIVDGSIGDYELIVQSVDTRNLFANINLQTTCFTLNKAGKTQYFKELFVENWNDYSTIPAEALTESIKLFNEEVEQYFYEKDGYQAIIHCSGGIGRTGAFLAARKIMQQIDQNLDPNIPSIIQELRLCRDEGMVCTAGQFQLCYSVKELYRQQKSKEIAALILGNRIQNFV